MENSDPSEEVDTASSGSAVTVESNHGSNIENSSDLADGDDELIGIPDGSDEEGVYEIDVDPLLAGEDIEINEMPIEVDSDGDETDWGDDTPRNEVADMSAGIRLISELNQLNQLLTDLSGHASRIAERLADTVEESSGSSSNSSVVEVEELARSPSEPVRSFVEHVVRRVTAGEIGITDGVLARLRRMVFRLDGHLQRRGLQLNSGSRPALSQIASNGTIDESQHEEHIDHDSIPPDDAVSFDTNLPSEHSYMGSNMNRVSGVNYLENGKEYNIMLFMHQHLLFPGEILPFMISENVFDDEEVDATNGLLFGVCFPFLLSENENCTEAYGVTCHIYERGSDESGNMLIKSRALQRFVMQRKSFTGPLQYIASHPRFKCRGVIKILPEIFLPEPLKCIHMGSMYRFRDNDSTRNIYKRYQAASTPMPLHVYEHYSITSILEKARTKLAQHKIETMPTDPVQLSFWLVRNLHLSEELAKSIFTTDSVNIRMKLIASSFKEDAIFVCRYCGSRIAECRELFAMSKYGVQTQYCNSAGYIHETNTVYRVKPDAVSFSGNPSAEFSWFPGYQWHIINCQVCTRHIGWQFKAVDPNLIPKSFYGISSSSVKIRTQPEPDEQADMYRGLVRLARRHME